MNHTLKHTLVAFAVATSSCFAAVTTHPIFGHHAILHRSDQTPVFGLAEPGEKVTVSLAGQTVTTVTPASGKWLVRLNLKQTTQGPHALKVNDRTFKDILVGEVWLCSGQSNMAFIMKSSRNAQEEAARSANDLLRTFNVPGTPSRTPLDTQRGYWMVASPQNTPRFTAVGYYFAKRLQQELKVPVGIVHASVGASSIQTWFPRDEIKASAALTEIFKPDDAFYHNYRQVFAQRRENLVAWQTKFNRNDSTPNLPQEGWKKYGDGKWLRQPGAIWYRQTVELKPHELGKAITFQCDPFNSQAWRLSNSTLRLFWNGHELQPSFQDDLLHMSKIYFTVPADLTKEKTNTIQVRQFNPSYNDQLYTTVWSRKTGNLGCHRGELCRETTLPPTTPDQKRELPPLGKAYFYMKYPCALYNGAINPLLPLGLSGVIWYQGESNAYAAKDYATLFPQLITIWRRKFQNPDLPFYWCQLANYTAKSKDPNLRSQWAELREAQTRTLALKQTGQAILIDAGEAQDIHPTDKETPGNRLAVIALAQVYGKNIPHVGPTFQKASPEGASMRISFTHLHGGLVAGKLPDMYPLRTSQNAYRKLVRNTPHSQLEGFAVAGEDGVFHWADARIEGDTVVVSSPKVPRPCHVRYGWQQNPTVNLYNQAGLPAVPFSTLKPW